MFKNLTSESHEGYRGLGELTVEFEVALSCPTLEVNAGMNRVGTSFLIMVSMSGSPEERLEMDDGDADGAVEDDIPVLEIVEIESIKAALAAVPFDPNWPGPS